VGPCPESSQPVADARSESPTRLNDQDREGSGMGVRRSVLAYFLVALLSLLLVVAPLAGAAPPAADDGRGPETGARAGDLRAA